MFSMAIPFRGIWKSRCQNAPSGRSPSGVADVGITCGCRDMETTMPSVASRSASTRFSGVIRFSAPS